jgi:peptide deformylase
MATNVLREDQAHHHDPDANVKLHKIITYGHPTLRVRCEPVTEFNDELRQLAAEMIATMLDADGVGLAAPQIDIPIRLLVVGVPQEDSDELILMAVTNPEVVEPEGTWDYEEGCLSIPDVRDTVTRPEQIRLRYQDLDGKQQEITAEGMLARVLQHEVDHLNGILFIDHLSPVRRALHSGKLKRLARENK